MDKQQAIDLATERIQEIDAIRANDHLTQDEKARRIALLESEIAQLRKVSGPQHIRQR